MTYLLLLPLLLAAVLQVVAASAAPNEAGSLGFGFRDVLVPVVTYWLAAVVSVVALVMLMLRAPGAAWLAVGAGALICAAPLAWGQATHQFTASHHLVRLALVVVVVVLCFLHDAVHR